MDHHAEPSDVLLDQAGMNWVDFKLIKDLLDPYPIPGNMLPPFSKLEHNINLYNSQFSLLILDFKTISPLIGVVIR